MLHYFDAAVVLHIPPQQCRNGDQKWGQIYLSINKSAPSSVKALSMGGLTLDPANVKRAPRASSAWINY